LAATHAPAQAAPNALETAIANPARSEANRARDRYRHPYETLTFFGVKPSDSVVEIYPGAGWYTEILAPYLAGQGSLAVVATDPQLKRMRDKAAADPAAFGKVLFSPLATWADAPAFPTGSADVVLTFRNVHNWHMQGQAAEAFKAFYKMLKPGGTLGVVEHRLPEGRPDSDMDKSGYMKRSAVVAAAEAAGFKLVAESEINANPKDTADWPEGVWTLPPSLRLGDKDREKYLAIGESDRMTLKFVKPR
jgi:predicted methyltransferase